MRHLIILLFGFFIIISCNDQAKVNINIPEKVNYETVNSNVSDSTYFDRVLGAIVGSAIGDAMGASTEMWDRQSIRKKYGYITGLTPATREKSPEGTWQHNLTAGATTDDTRWKLFMGHYLSNNYNNLNAQSFATAISSYYRDLTKDLGSVRNQDSTDALDESIQKMTWMKEWARVSMAYEDSPASYQKAQNRFYGGEMACAGILYSPMFGLISDSPERAYLMAYDHALFDIGYAKDITGLTAAMTSMALQSNSLDSILNCVLFVDPINYRDSRLIGRLAFSIADAADNKYLDSREISIDTVGDPSIPSNFTGTALEWQQQEYMYDYLTQDQKAIAFHVGEIWQILYTALLYGNGDFMKTMQFIVNYGRDNDTVAAVAGMILGAKIGYSNLPLQIRNQIISVSKETMGIDLEGIANDIIMAKAGLTSH